MENYSKQRVLAKNKNGNVLLCIDKRTNIRCIMHRVSLKNVPEEEKNLALEEELYFTQLRHPNILSYNTAFYDDKEALCTVTDFAPGGSLLDKLEKAQGTLFEESQILNWFTKICLALKYCHDRNVLHRDLQAKNIVFLRNGMLKVKGFVNTRVLLGTTNFTQTAQSAPFYFAPEICQGKMYTSKTEIWMLGCLLYQLCAQSVPFKANSITVLIRKIMKGQAAPIPYIYSSNMRNLVSMMLSKHPSKRPDINKILSMDFIASELHAIHDVTVENIGKQIRTKNKKPGKHPNAHKNSDNDKAKRKKEMKKEFRALELHTPKEVENQKKEVAKELCTTMRFDNFKLDPLPSDEKVDELKERIRKKKDEIREQVFREQHPELFVEEGEDCPPPVDPNLSALIHLSSDSSDSDDEFIELAAIAQSIFEEPVVDGEENIIKENAQTINSSFFTGVDMPSLTIPTEKGGESVAYRIEEIRSHLEKVLGFDTFVSAYELVKNSGDVKQEEIEDNLKKILTTEEQFEMYPLIQHLCVLEESF